MKCQFSAVISEVRYCRYCHVSSHGMISVKKQVCHLNRVHDSGHRPPSEMHIMCQHQKQQKSFLQKFRSFCQESSLLLATSSLTGRHH